DSKYKSHPAEWRADCGGQRWTNIRRPRRVGCRSRPDLYTCPGLLNEKGRREVEFAPKDAQLRDDVRTLGALVGDILREQCGDAFFQLVERARHAAIAGAGAGAAADDELHALVKEPPARDAETL